MITTLSRHNYFLLSPFADSFIADMQQSYAADLDETDKRDRQVLRERFDHRQPFAQERMTVDGHCVIALPAASKIEYHKRVPIQLMGLLTQLKSTQVSLLDFINTDFSQFPFENFSKRNQFRRLTAGMQRDKVVRFDISHITEMLPLFFFSGCYDVPVVFIISDGPVPLSLRLCDDGNFHLNFLEANRSLVVAAAELSGFVTGGIELCDSYSVAVF
jgi:hypothetical protein